MKKFREYHLLNIFEETDSSSFPLDAFLRNYFRKHKAIGSKDRQEICETLYGIIRWRGLLDYLCSKPLNWKKRIEVYQKFDPLSFQNDQKIPHHVRVSFPKFIFESLKQGYGESKAVDFCLNSNFPAPTTVRVNTLKISREELFKEWESKYLISLCTQSPWGIIFHEKINFFGLPEFKAGYFEVQDEGSQLIASEMDVKPGNHVLDFCAGSGGKSLAYAPKMGGLGQIHLYDIRQHMLVEARKRFKRAGIQNAHPLTDDHLKRKSLFNRMDWILLDVPCSGSGTLRRNPDMKWKITPEMIERLVGEQREIFAKALKFLHPKGKIVYATCSVFPEENERQISFFIKEYDLKLVNPPFLSSPKRGKMDGFFCAVLSK